MAKEFIQTSTGIIPLDALPIVKDENAISILLKCIVFYATIIILIFIIIYYISENNGVNKSGFYAAKLHDGISSHMVNKTPISVSADSISVFNPNNDSRLENILLIDANDNLIDIDIMYNPNVKIIQKNNGIVYSVDFKKEMQLKELGFISEFDRFIKYVDIKLYLHNDPVWSLGTDLKASRENFIKITEYTYDPEKYNELLESPVSYTIKPSKEEEESIIITNDKILGIKLMEDSEEYINY